MSYRDYGLALFFSTSILGWMICMLIGVLNEPIMGGFLLWAYIMYLPIIILIHLPLTAVTVMCAKYWKLKRYGGKFYSTLIYTSLSTIVYSILMADAMHPRAIIVLAIAAFLSSLLASSSLPKTEEQPKKLTVNDKIIG